MHFPGRQRNCWLAVLLLGFPGAFSVGQDNPEVIVGNGKTLAPDLAESRNYDELLQLESSVGLIDAVQPDGMSALHWLVFHNEAEIVQAWIAKGCSVDQANRYGITPLVIACQAGHAPIVKILLDAGADANCVLPAGESVLMIAARTGVAECVQQLVDAQADVDFRDRRQQTAVMWAAAEGNTAAFTVLDQAGADFVTPLQSGFTPFFFAVRQGHREMAQLLVGRGIDVNDGMVSPTKLSKSKQHGKTPLLLAIENGHFELADSLLTAGADPNDRRSGYAPLHALTWVRKPIRGDGNPAPIGSGTLSSLGLVQRLVDYGADVDIRYGHHNPGPGRICRQGATPFFLAAYTGDLAMLQLLLELGADPNIKNAEGCTPLLAAAGVDDLSSGDEPAATDAEAVAVVEFLLQHGADINAIDENGETAMHGAAYANRPEVVRVLMTAGANVEIWNSKNRYGRTPLDIAKGYRHGNFRPSPETEAAIVEAMACTAGRILNSKGE